MTQFPIFRAAAVQGSPVFLDLGATVAKACDLIRQAGSNGARLIGFPESYIPGFPAWIFRTGPLGKSAELYARLYRNAIDMGGREIAEIARAAREARIYVCISATERDGGSLYLCQLWFDPEGNLIGKHRKLRPTGPERYIWGDGDGSMMPVMETPLGNLGGLLCWEHLVPLTSAAMSAMNEQIHVASWPLPGMIGGNPYAPMHDLRLKGGVMPAYRMDMHPNEIISRNYAMATQTFVLMATGVMTRDAIDIMSVCVDPSEMKLGGGGSRIIAPDGGIVSEDLPPDEEGLVYAEIVTEMIIYAKYMCDPGGHYAVPNVLNLNFNRTPARAAEITGEPGRQRLIDNDALENRLGA